MLRTASVVLAATAAIAQPQDTRPAFEAASIKLNNSVSGNSSTHGSRGQVMMSNQALKRLVERAFQVKPFQVSGPSWMEDVRFDIAAKYPEATKDADRAPMLRTLLEDRFKLAVHRETKEMPGYALVVAKGGFKLKPAEAGGASTNTNSNGRVWKLTVKSTSMEQLADLLSRQLGQMVRDQTGIQGVYDFEFRWTNNDQGGAGKDADKEAKEAEALPSLFTALEETVGVRLQPKKVPVEMIVVDHIERMPIEN